MESILFFLKKIFKIQLFQHFLHLKNALSFKFFFQIFQAQILFFFINIFYWFTMKKNYQLNAKKI